MQCSVVLVWLKQTSIMQDRRKTDFFNAETSQQIRTFSIDENNWAINASVTVKMICRWPCRLYGQKLLRTRRQSLRHISDLHRFAGT